MGMSFSPTQGDLERYRRLRAISMDLNQTITKTIPRKAIYEVGDAMGILRDGIIVLDSEDMSSVLMDCCLYDWFENGKNIVQRYAEQHATMAQTDEQYLLRAYLAAKYRVLVVESALPGSGLYCQDVLNGGGLFLMDVGLSRSIPVGEAAFATRTIPLGEHWMTTGAGLPITSPEEMLKIWNRTKGENQRLLEGPSAVPLLIVRACLATGAADYVKYESVAKHPKKKARRWRRF